MLLGATHSYAIEQRNLQVVCDKTSTILNSLQNSFKEIGIISGKGVGPTPHTLSVWGNPETNTFTILDTHGDTTCVLGVGEEIQILLQAPEPTGPKI